MVRLTSTPAYHGSGPVMYYPPSSRPSPFAEGPGPLLWRGYDYVGANGRPRVYGYDGRR